MKKQPKRLRLSSETVRAMSTVALEQVAGGLARVSRGTCGVGDCFTYYCLTNVGCA